MTLKYLFSKPCTQQLMAEYQCPKSCLKELLFLTEDGSKIIYFELMLSPSFSLTGYSHGRMMHCDRDSNGNH